MKSRDLRDVIGGVTLIAVGLATILYSWANYDIGNMRSPGLGMFPTGLAVLLTALGLVIVVCAPVTRDRLPKIHFRALAVGLGSLIAFALIVDHFGLLPAVAILTLTGTLGSDTHSFLGRVFMAGSFSVLAIFIFRILLGLPITIARWPF